MSYNTLLFCLFFLSPNNPGMRGSDAPSYDQQNNFRRMNRPFLKSRASAIIPMIGSLCRDRLSTVGECRSSEWIEIILLIPLMERVSRWPMPTVGNQRAELICSLHCRLLLSYHRVLFTKFCYILNCLPTSAFRILTEVDNLIRLVVSWQRSKVGKFSRPSN